jgi:hypothetical protein
MTRARVYIDYQKLEEAIAAIGFKKSKVAKGMGYSDSLFCNAKDRGYFGEDVAERLDRIYGIKRKAYEIPAPKPEEPKTEETKPEHAEEQKCSIDYVKLYNTIYQAVLTALQENAKGLHDRLFEVK